MHDRRRQRTQAEYDDLQNFNFRVPIYLWYTIAVIIGIATVLNILREKVSFHRRRQTFRRLVCESRRGSVGTLANVGDASPVVERGGSKDIESVAGNADSAAIKVGTPHFKEGTFEPAAKRRRSPLKACGALVSASQASVRKVFMRRSRLAGWLCMGGLGEVFLIFGYLAANLTLVFVHTDNDIDWQAHHAGRLVFGNLPLIIGLAGKNNVISYLTGYSYASLNLLHRWAARMSLLLACIHVGGRVYVGNDLNHGYTYWGIAAFILFPYMVLSAARWFRNRWYQFFILSHVSCFMLFLACLWVHRPSSASYIYSGIILWGLDRIARTVRILWHYGPSQFYRRSPPSNTLLEALPGDTLRVSVRTPMSWIPGQHVYLHVPAISAGGHPFSVATVSRALDESGNDGWGETLRSWWAFVKGKGLHCPKVRQQVMIIRVREGLTRKLYEYAQANMEDGGKVGIYAWTEGPYGNLHHMNEFESLLLVAGGSGISYTLPLLWDTVRRARSMRPPYNNLRDAVATTRIVFVWVIRAVEHASWCSEMLDQICKAIPRGFELVIRIYVTGKKAEIPAQVQPSEPVISQDEEEITVVGTVNGPRVLLGSEIASPTTSPISVGGATMQGQPSACDENKTEDTTAQNTPASVSMTLSPEPSAWPSAQTHAGRPDLADLLESLIERTHPSARVGVACCGPDSLSRSAASAVVGAMDPKRVLKGENRRKVGFNVEEFGW